MIMRKTGSTNNTSWILIYFRSLLPCTTSYISGGEHPTIMGELLIKGVDCSGFVWRTLQDKFHISLDRVTTEQLIHMGEKISPKSLQPGDLVFFRINNELHVGFYDIDHHFIHASVSKGVTRSSMDAPYWKKSFIVARRLPRISKAFSLANAVPSHIQAN